MADVITDRSGTTSAGASSSVAVANSSRRGFYFQNVSDTDMWLRMDGSASVAGKPALKIPPGGLYEMPGNGIRLQAITVYCTAAKDYSASEW